MQTSDSVAAAKAVQHDLFGLTAALMILGLLAGCGQHHRSPPPSLAFGGLPVSGSLADALRAGFNACIADNVSMRCRRNGVMLNGHGPYDAAVDLDGGDGSGGFHQLTLWHDSDQDALVDVTDELRRNGWSECLTGGNRGDEAIYTRENSPVLLALDLSYWSKRRLRVMPARNNMSVHC